MFFLKKLRKSRKRQEFFRNILLLFGVVALFGASLIVLWIANFKIPTLESFEERRVTQSTKIYDRTGEVLLYDVFQDVKRTVVPYDQISRNIKNATVAIEDAEFYEHNGIKPTAVVRAMLVNLGSGEFTQGGSTITQQVVKNSLLTSDKRISRKLKEWVLALKLEQVLPKDEILHLYLNEIPYGGSIYGIEEASNAFFGKKSLDLTIAESAYLAALPQAPTYFSPYGNNRDKLENRKNLVLSRMLENGFISPEEFESAQKEEVEFKPRQSLGIKAPHFVVFVRNELIRKYGEQVLEEGGLRITTTLDYELQEKAEEIVKRYALENKEKFDAENAALVAIDPQTGGILAMVGSRDYFDEEIDGNFNVALAHRQPGSAFKPFAYAAAFNKGYLPDTVLFDVKTEFSSNCSPSGDPLYSGAVCYNPVNYDNVFRGPVSMRNALAQSINIPAIKTLYLAGMQDTLRLARDMGIRSLTDINRYGLTMVLGGGEVSLLDITSAYSVFANDGMRNPYVSILKIEDNKGKVLETFSPRPKRVLNEQTSRMISDVLSDNVARTPAFGQYSFLHFPGRDVAVKTGTTNDYKDAWIVGYTPHISVGAWAGNNDNTPMDKKVAGFIIAPLWNEFMNAALPKYPNTTFTKPLYSTNGLKPVLRGEWKGGESYFIDTLSGKLATEFTPPELREERFTGGAHSILYWVDKNNPRGPRPTNPGGDSQFLLWETSVREWAIRNNIIETGPEAIPAEVDDIHKPEFFPNITLSSPQENQVYSLVEKVDVQFSHTNTYPISHVDFFLNEQYIGKTTIAPYTFSFIPGGVESVQENNTLKVVMYDSQLNRGEDTVSFTVR